MWQVRTDMRTMASSIATSSTTHRARVDAASQLAARSPTVPAPTWPSPGADVAESRRRRGRVPAPTWPSPGANVAESRRRRGRVPAPTWPSPGADVAESRHRRGRVPAPTWPSPGADVGRAALAQPNGPIGESDVQRRRRVRCSAIDHRPLPSHRMDRALGNARHAPCIMRRATCAAQQRATVNSRCDAEDYSQTRRSLPKADDRPLPPKAAHRMRAIGGSASRGEQGACAGAVTVQRQRPFPSASKGE